METKFVEVADNSFHPIEKGESFTGSMPLLIGVEKTMFEKQLETLYGGDGKESGKWGEVFLSGNKATKIFYQPDNLLNIFDMEFIRKYGGVAGLPKFIGVVPNGYQMERLKGESLGKLVNTELDRDYYNKEFTSKEKLQRVISKEQGQELLNKIVEFHKETRRVHGNLGKLDNIIIDSLGKIRLIDPEWEKIGDQTPGGELKDTFLYLTQEYGFTGLTLSGTISDNEAKDGLKEFTQSVIAKVEMNPVIGSKIIKFKDQKVDLRMTENGEIMVRKMI